MLFVEFNIIINVINLLKYFFIHIISKENFPNIQRILFQSLIIEDFILVLVKKLVGRFRISNLLLYSSQQLRCNDCSPFNIPDSLCESQST